MEDFEHPGICVIFAVLILKNIDMRKIDLKLLMEKDWFSPIRGQVLLHALCNLKSVPYVANMGGISAESLSPKVQEVYSVCGMHNGATGDYGTSSLDIQDLASTLIDRGEISEAQLENEIASLMSTVYSDPGYINSMTPFF